eukprot:3472065-Prymnesium_polylepis.1
MSLGERLGELVTAAVSQEVDVAAAAAATAAAEAAAEAAAAAKARAKEAAAAAAAAEAEAAAVAEAAAAPADGAADVDPAFRAADLRMRAKIVQEFEAKLARLPFCKEGTANRGRGADGSLLSKNWEVVLVSGRAGHAYPKGAAARGVNAPRGREDDAASRAN